jgi:hypothetical protein
MLDRCLVEACKAGNANAIKLAYQLNGDIDDKNNAQKIDGTYLARAILLAKRELESEGYVVKEETNNKETVDEQVGDSQSSVQPVPEQTQ